MEEVFVKIRSFAYVPRATAKTMVSSSPCVPGGSRELQSVALKGMDSVTSYDQFKASFGKVCLTSKDVGTILGNKRKRVDPKDLQRRIIANQKQRKGLSLLHGMQFESQCIQWMQNHLRMPVEPVNFQVLDNNRHAGGRADGKIKLSGIFKLPPRNDEDDEGYDDAHALVEIKTVMQEMDVHRFGTDDVAQLYLNMACAKIPRTLYVRIHTSRMAAWMVEMDRAKWKTKMLPTIEAYIEHVNQHKHLDAKTSLEQFLLAHQCEVPTERKLLFWCVGSRLITGKRQLLEPSYINSLYGELGWTR